MSRAEVYERVTRGIIERLEAGVAPWHKPWDPAYGRPRNMVSGRPYNGVNALVLGLSGRRPHWLTLKQVNRMGFRLRKGSKGVPILYAKKSTVRETDEEGKEVRRDRFLMRFYYVFNADDVDGLEVKDPGHDPGRDVAAGIPAAQAILDGVQPPPDLRVGDQACFVPALDHLLLPAREAFEAPEAYYATAFHELTHWTGHKSRLARETITTAAPFGSAVYSQEELVAEMGAGFLCALAGIENKTIDQSASYLDHWLRNLKADPGLIVRAAAQAQKAVDYLAPTGGTSKAASEDAGEEASDATAVPTETPGGAPGSEEVAQGVTA